MEVLSVALVVININIFLASDGSCAVILKRCIHALSNEDYLDLQILKTLHTYSFPVINTWSLKNRPTKYFCEDFFVVCEFSLDVSDCIDYIYNFTKTTKMRHKLRFMLAIRFYKNNIINDEDLIRKLTTHKLNVLITWRSMKRIYLRPIWSYNISIGKTQLYAPLINMTVSTKLRDYAYNTTIDGLFFQQYKYLASVMIRQRRFRVSLFECPPFVIYAENKIDGLEYRITEEMSKHWNLTVMRRDFSQQISDPWSAVKDDVVKDRADMAMCSIWLTNDNWTLMDFTQSSTALCATFLVPKPSLIDPAVYIILPLQTWVWVTLFISMFVAMLWLYVVAVKGNQ